MQTEKPFTRRKTHAYDPAQEEESPLDVPIDRAVRIIEEGLRQGFGEVTVKIRHGKIKEVHKTEIIRQ